MQRTKGEYCDVCICISEKRYLAHKCVLSANCRKLDELIQLASKKSGHTSDIEIEINNINADAFELLLEYFYSGNLNINGDNFMAVVTAANQLDLQDVVAKCTEIFSITHIIDPNGKELSPLAPVSAIPHQHLEQSVVVTKEHDKKDESIEEDKLSPSGNLSVHSIYQSEDPAFVHNPNGSPMPICSNEVIIDVNQTLGQPLENSGGGARQKLINTIPVTADDFEINDGGSKDCKTMMEQVSQLRLQHQHLQELQRQQQQQQNQNFATYSGGSGAEETVVAEQPARKKPRKSTKASSNSNNVPTTTTTSTTNDQYIFEPNQQQMHDSFDQSHLTQTMGLLPVTGASSPGSRQTHNSSPNPPRGSVNPPTDFRIVTEEVRQALYTKYDSFKAETPIGSTCDVAELLQRGRSRNRKTTEQNCLNTTIRLVLDTMQIVDSTDPRVEDALILIMDKFETLREHINDQAIRRLLRVKVRHSIHCKKWRNKKKLQGQSLMTSADDFNNLMMMKNNSGEEEDLHD